MTQREFDQHVAAFDRLARHVDDMDRNGTRGVGRIEIQTTELVKDVTELKADTAAWQVQHETRHDVEVRERRIGRRWVLATAIAALAALATIAAMVGQLLGRPVP